MHNLEPLKKTRSFKQVYDSKIFAANRLLVLYKRQNGSAVTRLGISISRKVGKAVVRNRIKRIVKENFRRLTILPGYDLVVVVRPPASALSSGQTYFEIGQALAQLLQKQELLDFSRKVRL